MMGGNKVEKTDDLVALKGMKQLFQINFLSNPIVNEPGYRNKVFSMFPSLTVLDGLDKGGKDAFNATSMANTTSRVPTSLFDTSPSIPSSMPFAPTTSLFSSSIPAPLFPPRSIPRKTTVSPRAVSVSVPKIGKSGKSGKSGKASKVSATSSKSMSSRAGLVFPVGRIRRHLKENDSQFRVSRGAPIFMAAFLEYMTA